MENNISIRIYVKDGRLEHVVPESPWEGQIDVQVIYQTFPGALSHNMCAEESCPEGPDFHWHDYFSTAVIRAESRK